MITQEKLNRINFLAKKAKTAGLSAVEKAEQDALRREYIKAYKQSLRAQLDNTVVVRPDGTKERLADKKKKN